MYTTRFDSDVEKFDVTYEESIVTWLTKGSLSVSALLEVDPEPSHDLERTMFVLNFPHWGRSSCQGLRNTAISFTRGDV